ncbi:MAG: serine hydrolase, partial [Bacteroidales bacterium]|nr:serine hydrolase [Bacteroidales bacterium]
LIGIDGEWGVGMRVTDAHSFPYAMNVGAVKDTTLVYEMGKQIGEHCHRLGVHINFAPVHDLNSNPLNPVINFRSYGSGTQNVSSKVCNYVAGMQSQGVLAVAKHFPGHGDTQTDSHFGLPVINKTRAQFEAQELLPFRQSIDKGLQAVMMGHLKVPALDSHDLPASLSPEIICGILKQEMGFDGLVVSDALNMDAVAKGYKNHYLKAFVAGNDILLFPADLGEGVRQLKEGLRNGEISIEELDERCLRVLSYKKALGVPYFHKIPTENVVLDLNPVKSEVLNRQLLTQSMTLVRNVDNALPLQELDRKRIAVISINNDSKAFGAQMRLYAKVCVFNETVKTSEDIARLLPQLAEYDEIIVGLHGNQKRKGTNYGVNKQAIALMIRLAQEKPVHGVVMANPYALRQLTGAEFVSLQSLTFTYGNEEEIQRLAADAIFGGIGYQGVFPLDVNTFLKEGLSYTTRACRVAYTPVPEEVGLNRDTLAKIDTLIEEMIAEEMAPGCQILVAKNGKVAYHKAFGYHTYDKVREVKTTDIYDLASVTKVAATTPLVMQFADEGRVNINTSIDHYLPELKGHPKGKLTLKELLLHQAGLQSHIGFDFEMIDEENLPENLFHKGRTSTYSIKLTPTIYMTRNYVMKEGYLSAVEDEQHEVKVAEGIYTFAAYRDSMYQMMDDLELCANKDYRYSDLGFYYVMRILEAVSQKSMDSLAMERLYQPLGMYKTAYKPLDHFWK